MTAPATPLRPYCKACGWRKGGLDSWDGRACKCGHSEPPIKRVEDTEMNTEVRHFYRMFRGNFERTAESAYQSARAHVAFLKRLGAMVSEGNRRSKAAKLGHRRRAAER